MESKSTSDLSQSLGPLTIWGLGVGYVISGMYFGWNLGLPHGGSYGFLAATLLVTVLYICFVASYAELACMLPRAGGAFVYSERAFGPTIGFLTGIAQIIEFTFATPAIAAAIGAYFSLFFPELSPVQIGFAAYMIFTAINIAGIKQSARFELFITVFAVVELLIFSAIALPFFSWEAFSSNALPNGWLGILPAIPYAIWFYLGIEGIANIAEEAKNPEKNLHRGFSLAMATLIILALLVLFAAVGVNGWSNIVFAGEGKTTSDSPLPMAMFKIVGGNHIFYHLLVSIGLFGLIASFHGIMIAASRSIFEMGRSGFLPELVGRTMRKTQTPAWALIVNMIIGMIALVSGKTGQLIILSVFGALTLYIVSLLALFRLRVSEKSLDRPYRTPLYPILPGIGVILAGFCLCVMVFYEPWVGLVYIGVLLAAFVFGKNSLVSLRTKSF